MARSPSASGKAIDLNKAREIFGRVKKDLESGAATGTEKRLDADLIRELLQGGGQAPMSAFTMTFIEYYGIDRKVASRRAREGMKVLVNEGVVHKTDDKRALFSLTS